MRIALLTRSLGYGGAERQITALARGASGSHEVDLLVFYAGGGLSSDAAGVRIVDLGKKGRWDLPGFLFKLRRSLVAGEYDVVYAFNWSPNLLLALLRPFLPQGMRIVWGVRSSNVDMKRYGLFVWLSDVVQPLLSRLPDLIIVNSHAGRADVVGRGFPADRVVVVANGIDVDRFAPNGKARRETRRRLGLGDDEYLVGIVSRLDPMKDHATFLRALAAAVSVGIPVVPLIVGSGPKDYKGSIERMAGQLGLRRAIFLEATGCVETLYPAMDVHVSASSDGEGFSNALGEALACGVPCLATDVGDAKLVIGDAGLVVPPKDPSAMAEAIVRMWSSKEDLRSRARDRILENFTLTRMVEQTLSCLERL